jgi:hypothetical protein
MDNARQVARWIVDDIISDLSGRKGLDNEWDNIDSDVQREIATTWLNMTEEYVKKYEPFYQEED